MYKTSSVSLRLQAYRGSVRPFVNFNAKHDAEILHKAMKGIGQSTHTLHVLLLWSAVLYLMFWGSTGEFVLSLLIHTKIHVTNKITSSFPLNQKNIPTCHFQSVKYWLSTPSNNIIEDIQVVTSLVHLKSFIFNQLIKKWNSSPHLCLVLKLFSSSFSQYSQNSCLFNEVLLLLRFECCVISCLFCCSLKLM